MTGVPALPGFDIPVDAVEEMAHRVITEVRRALMPMGTVRCVCAHACVSACVQIGGSVWMGGWVGGWVGGCWWVWVFV